jgi:HEPN domain-containing protein
MKGKRFPPDDSREWIRRARSNLALARALQPKVELADYCFDAQQCAEKAIKAVFVERGETFPYIHDLKRLIRLLERNGVTIPKYLREADELSRYAFETRYPGPDSFVPQREYRRAVRIAERVLAWAERQIVVPKIAPKPKK